MAGVRERPALEGPGPGPGQRQERCQRIRARGTSSSRLGAYASDAVLDALEAASLAHSEVRARYAHRDALREQIRLARESGRPQAAPDGQTMLDAHRQIDPALQEAEVKDEVLIKLMRDELRSKPEAAALPAAVPVRRRRFWHRRQRPRAPLFRR